MKISVSFPTVVTMQSDTFLLHNPGFARRTHTHRHWTFYFVMAWGVGTWRRDQFVWYWMRQRSERTCQRYKLLRVMKLVGHRTTRRCNATQLESIWFDAFLVLCPFVHSVVSANSPPFHAYPNREKVNKQNGVCWWVETAEILKIIYCVNVTIQYVNEFMNTECRTTNDDRTPCQSTNTPRKEQKTKTEIQ